MTPTKIIAASSPYTSPTGVVGAVVAGLLAAMIFVGVMLNPDYRLAILAIAAVFVLGLVSFGVWGRKRLILSPEEEYALSGGLHADDSAGSHDEDPLDELLVTR